MEADIYITIKEGILDPEGKAISGALRNIGITGIREVKTGKFIRLYFDNSMDEETIREKVLDACEKLLVNPNIETYRFEIIRDDK